MSISKENIFILLFFLLGCTNEQLVTPIQEPLPPFELNEWAPIGAKWYYSDESLGVKPEEGNGYYLIESTRDTTIENISAKVLEITHFYLDKIESTRTEIMYGDMEKVYHWDAYEENFYMLYNFAAMEGDTIKVRDEPFINYWGITSSYFIATVDSVSLMYIHDLPLKKFKIRPFFEDNPAADQSWQYAEGGVTANVIQGIGSTFWMFGGMFFSLPSQKAHVGLRCFEYNGHTYKYNDYPLDCDYINPNPE